MVAASVLANTIFSAAYFQGFGVLILPIERAFGWDRWVISAAMSLRQLESGIVSPAVGFLLDRFSARKLIFWSAVISGFGFIGLGFTAAVNVELKIASLDLKTFRVENKKINERVREIIDASDEEKSRIEERASR